MRKTILPVLLIGLSATAPPAGGSDGIKLGVTGGTLGLGVQAAYVFSQHFSVRGVAAALDFSTEFETGELRYPVDAELRNAGVLVDYRPWGGHFRISGGVYFNDNTLSGKAVC